VLYGFPRSGLCAVELALSEIGVAYEVRGVDLLSDQQRDADYLAVNPQRKLPTLITPDGETLTESSAILITLATRHPEAGLLPPPGSAGHAQALRWLLFIATEIYPIVEISDYPERFTPTDGNSDDVREIGRKIWRERWSVVENQITGDPWFFASGFSLVDIYVAVVSRWAQQQDWRLTHIPKVEAITAAIAARESCVQVWADANW
jgi:GST-like protein